MAVYFDARCDDLGGAILGPVLLSIPTIVTMAPTE